MDRGTLSNSRKGVPQNIKIKTDKEKITKMVVSVGNVILFPLLRDFTINPGY